MTFVVCGTRLYGYCDEIKGIGHVETKFFHLNYMPLVPLTSYFMFDRSDGASGNIARGIRNSGKSVAKTYLIVLGFVVALILFCLGISNQDDHIGSAWINWVMMVAGILSAAGTCYGRRWGRTASFERAMYIAQEELASPVIAEAVQLLYSRGPEGTAPQSSAPPPTHYQDAAEVSPVMVEASLLTEEEEEQEPLSPSHTRNGDVEFGSSTTEFSVVGTTPEYVAPGGDVSRNSLPVASVVPETDKSFA